MKLMFVGYLHGFGGAEKMIIMLANAMAERGHKVMLLSFVANNPCYEIDPLVEYKFIPDEGNKLFGILKRYKKLKEAIKNIKPDVVVNFCYQSAYFTALMNKCIVGKTIYAERGDPSDKEYSGLMAIVRKLVLPRIDGFVFQTRGAQNYFNNSVIKKSVVIHNPVLINANDYPITLKRKKVIVNVGRLHEQKNQALLIKAFAKLANKFCDYKLEIYGIGELEIELKELAKYLGIIDKVDFKGNVPQVYNNVYGASLFVLSSDYEGMPNALMEAMAVGTPCISTDCKPGGAKELITNGVNGLITSINSVDELSEAMKYIIEHPEEAEEMGRKAKEICSTHNVQRIIKMWEKYIVKIINE